MRFIIYDDNVHAVVDLHASYTGKLCKTALLYILKKILTKL